MPQAPRKDNQVQRAQDKESKRARGALSCAECRRLKLKCDKTVPCSSCKRRGCSAICPNGSLITGQGTRFVLADTETLHQKIAVMSDRIRQLEDALAILQSTVTGPAGEPHPLLQRDLLKIKSSIELHSASVPGGQDELRVQPEDEEGEEDAELHDTFGTLAIRDDGAATFYGRSAGSESLLIGETSTTTLYPTNTPTSNELSPLPSHYTSTPEYSPHTQSVYNGKLRQGRNGSPSLHGSVAALASTFPLAPSLSQSSSSSSSSPASHASGISNYNQKPLNLETIVANFLPSYAEVVHMMHSYLELAPWFFGAVTRNQIESEIMPLWYDDAQHSSTSPSAFPTVASPGAVAKRHRTSHDLALLFVLCCFGALNDGNLPPAPDNAPAEKYYQLTKAALSLDPGGVNGVDPKSSRNGLLERPPSVSTVQTLSMMAIYEGMCSGENSIETTWALMGLAGKLAQSIGLHRDCARWKLSPAEVQKRRALFWELFITDCWQSLATGRLATFSLPFVDCELPSDPDQTIADDGSIIPSFPYWKARFGAECVSAVVQGTLTSRAPKYSIILDLDRKVRDMELPSYAQGSPPQGVGLAQTMSHFMPHNYRELTLLYIHRCFFAHAISSNPLDPIKSQYAPSFLAGYRSACTIVSSVKQQFSLFPAQIARFWVLWTHAFSASVMLASVATNSSRSKIAPAALLELNNACDLFQRASAFGGRAVKFLPIMHRLQMKAQQAFRDANNGIPPSVPNDIFRPTQAGAPKDEMSIFSGKTNTVTTKVHSSAASAKAGPSTSTIALSSRGSSSGKESRASSGSPRQMFTDNPQFANVHPSLVSELHDFHGHIKAQIQNAMRNGEELFAGAPMVVDSAPALRHRHSQKHIAYHAEQAIVLERQEHERADAERREIEELERQEAARKQQLQQQLEIQRQYTQQHELQRQQDAHQQQQLDMQRQQEKMQQQRQEQYRQQVEAQQQQMQHQHQQQHMPQYRQHSYDSDEPVYAPVGALHHASQPSPSVRPERQNSHPYPAPAASQGYPAPLPHQQYHHAIEVPTSAAPHSNAHHPHHTIQPPHPQTTAQPPQHAMYPVPSGYSHRPAPDIVHAGPPPPDAHHAPGYTPGVPYAQQAQESYKYWPAASGSFAMPDQQPAAAAYAHGGHLAHQHYTPEGALRGIAADDRSLQETWQSYMEKVGSPRQFFED